MKKLLTLALALLLVLAACALPSVAEEERYVVYVAVPEGWENPCLWAWSDDGANAFAAWPGGEMEPDPANEGWYYAYLPAFANNVIINANEGGVQTGDMKLEGPAWITVTDAESVDISYDAQTEGEAPAYVETFTVYAAVPEDWQNPCLWAWAAPEGTNAFAAWPGKAMRDLGDGWFSANVPVWVNSIIVNANEGGVQTEDIEIDAADLWVTVAEDGSYDFTFNDPNAKVAENITVYVQVPEDWADPCLWAWSAPDGTNAFAAWPGEKLEPAASGGWLMLEAPGWINSVIVNGNSGSVQTEDIEVEPGRDLFLVVEAADTYTLTYEEP